jgi:mercuric ion transport protein
LYELTNLDGTSAVQANDSGIASQLDVHPEAQTDIPARKFLGLGAAGALIASIGTLSCCVLPLALFSLGASGAWMGNLTALAPYQPWFIGAAVLLIGVGFWRVYRRPKAACADDSYCASPASGKVVKGALWLSALLVAAAIAFNEFAPYLLSVE